MGKRHAYRQGSKSSSSSPIDAPGDRTMFRKTLNKKKAALATLWFQPIKSFQPIIPGLGTDLFFSLFKFND